MTNANGPETPSPYPAATTATPPKQARQHHPLRLALILAAVGAVVLVYLYVRSSSRRGEMLRTQQACLTYERPAGQVVYEEDPGRAAALLEKGDPHYVAVPAGGGSTEPRIAGHVPDVWRAMRRLIRRVPDDGEPHPADDAAVLFLHERKTMRGKRVLVCVDADRAGRRLRVTVIHPGGSTLDPTPVDDVTVAPRPTAGLVYLSTGDEPFAAKLPPAEQPDRRSDLRFYAGRPGRDESTMVLPYEFDGRTGELELTLQDDRTVFYLDRQYASLPGTRPATRP